MNALLMLLELFATFIVGVAVVTPYICISVSLFLYGLVLWDRGKKKIIIIIYALLAALVAIVIGYGYIQILKYIFSNLT
jgi:hypothetical protein